jgi:hypothetical protein
VSRVTNPLRAKARIEAGPATPAAMPVSTKIPAPIIAPTPIMVASKSPRSRAKVGSPVAPFPAPASADPPRFDFMLRTA